MVHNIHIPVMGICYTADTPIRVAQYGIASVISLVDDGLLEEYRMAYGARLGRDVGPAEALRAARIRAYLDFVASEVEEKFRRLCGLRVGGGKDAFAVGTAGGLNAKDRYFLMLPADSPLRAEYDAVCGMSGLRRVAAEADLTKKMEAGEIQVNIMVNLNHENAAIEAVRGFAKSKVCGSLVLSAGINLSVFEEIAKHKVFYRLSAEGRDANCPLSSNCPRKKIILKVSDYRSALTQGRYLAKKGLEVYEYRIESGVNCGGHAFIGAGKTLPEVLQEFAEKKSELFEETRRLIAKFAEKNASANILPPEKSSRITAQGGLCTAEEIRQVLDLGADGVGVATPFLLVPEVTSCDKKTRTLLAYAGENDVYLSHASPLGIPFQNLCTSTAATLCREKATQYLQNASDTRQRIGFPCTQHYLCRKIEGFEKEICPASLEYVSKRLADIAADELSGKITASAAREQREELAEHECICRFLGNAGREELREKAPRCNYMTEEIATARAVTAGEVTARAGNASRKIEPITVCPGPSIAYFSREYSLLEMMQHLYGTGTQLTPANKPHAFELEKRLLAQAAQF